MSTEIGLEEFLSMLDKQYKDSDSAKWQMKFKSDKADSDGFVDSLGRAETETTSINGSIQSLNIISKQKFGDSTRNGLVMSHHHVDKHVLELIRDMFGDELAQDIFFRLNVSGSRKTRAVALRIYFKLTAYAVLLSYPEVELPTIEEIYVTNPLTPINLACRLHLLVSEIEEIVEDVEVVPAEYRDVSAIEFLSIQQMSACMDYHRLSMLLIERESLYEMKKGAEKRRSENKPEMSEALEIARIYIESLNLRGDTASVNGTAKHVHNKLKSKYGTAKSVRQINRWITDAEMI